MANILVVDDEPMICEGVTTLLANAGLDIGEIYTANNGFEALDYIRLEKVDLLITDIQMELMSGIELIETIFAENSMIPVIVLSAHGEFSYAQQALRYGVKEYIVKPVLPAELVRVVAALLPGRSETPQLSPDAVFAKRFSLDDMASKRSYVLNELITERLREPEAEAIFEYLGCRFDGPYYCLLAVNLDFSQEEDGALSFRDRNLLKYAALNVVEETLGNWDRLVFYSGSRTLTVVLQFSEDELAPPSRVNEQTMIAQLIHYNLLHYVRIRSVTGISTIRQGIGCWPELHEEARQAQRWGEVHPDHAVFYIEDVGRRGDDSGEAAAGRSGTLEETNSFIASAVRFIDENFRRKGLKLQEIAEHACLSPNYLSFLFKKNVGINLWDYVTKLRMEEGKRLLLATDMRRYEIADEVGYETPEHFSKIFKKHFGINPSEAKSTAPARKS